ncbi:hypothetical protein ABZT47_15605 [Sphaerisporangium sp. NPDC005289]|uniref:hypothetical protein n=1 Tax=Sphaerisporangium sp. NPDC005289 TaxID=3155247 RepID=UPI0033A023D8
MGLLRLPLVLYPWFAWLVVLLAFRAVDGGSPVPTVLLIGPALLIGLMIRLDIWSARVLSPRERARKLLSDGTGIVYGLVFVGYAYAAGLLPFIVDFWHRHSMLGRYEIVLALFLSGHGYLPAVAAVTRILGPIYVVFEWFVVRKGWTAFLVGVFSGDRGIAEFAAWLVLFESLAQLHHLFLSKHQPLWRYRRIEAHHYLGGTPAYRRKVAELWIEQDVRGQTYPSLGLVHTLCDEAMVAAQDRDPHPEMARFLRAEKRPGQAANAWLTAASELLAQARRALPAPEPTQRRELDLAEAHLIRYRAHLEASLGKRERALASQRKVRELWTKHELHNISANNLCVELIGARAEETQPVVPEHALAELHRHLDQPGLVPYVRFSLLLLAAEYATLTGDLEGAASMRTRRHQYVIGRTDFRVLNREQRAAGMPTFPARQYRLTLAGLEALDARTRGHILSVDESTRPPRIILANLPGGRAGTQAEAGMRLWLLGRTAEGAAMLSEAADLLERGGFKAQAFTVLFELGTAQRVTDPAAAYATLTRALHLQQRLRAGLADADLRLATGRAAEHLARTLADLLLRTLPAPAPPALTMFDLAELSRSRVLLDQLGTRPTRPITYPALRALLAESG